jgi:hypothetical protein
MLSVLSVLSAVIAAAHLVDEIRHPGSVFDASVGSLQRTADRMRYAPLRLAAHLVPGLAVRGIANVITTHSGSPENAMEQATEYLAKELLEHAEETTLHVIGDLMQALFFLCCPLIQIGLTAYIMRRAHQSSDALFTAPVAVSGFVQRVQLLDYVVARYVYVLCLFGGPGPIATPVVWLLRYMYGWKDDLKWAECQEALLGLVYAHPPPLTDGTVDEANKDVVYRVRGYHDAVAYAEDEKSRMARRVLAAVAIVPRRRDKTE